MQPSKNVKLVAILGINAVLMSVRAKSKPPISCLWAEVGSADSNTGGGGAAGIIGGMIGGTAGGIIGGFRTKKLEADVVLSLTNVRTSESNAYEGHQAKNDISWGAGGGIGFGGAVGGGYEDTEVGRIVTQAFIVAYGEMVRDLGGASDVATQAAPSKTYAVQMATTMRSKPNAKSPVIRALPVGLELYPTGQQRRHVVGSGR